MIPSPAEDAFGDALPERGETPGPPPDVTFWAARGGLLLKRARHAANMNQKALAGMSGTSRTTLSAYEHGRKSPTLETAGRILDAAGFRLTLEPKVSFVSRQGEGGHPFHVPDRLPRLPAAKALASVRLGGKVYDLADRTDRREAYALLVRQGSQRELLDHLDGVLLVELWDELVLPEAVRAAWAPLMELARGDKSD
ncbi:helix-turn-helix transcriptional regulator [Nonomuraea rhizosphaerae]|uniref:helix-turn-helix transcriptional regulator n=1 Tax=Nonomuraea rhizosphaerae TaxID=2665663 RepID=UPI001C5E9BB3|nr:helix-turn-helix transcriptional regulator [Nonomuraea rhizosphaerae]